MSWTMRIPILLAFLACAGHGRRVQLSTGDSQREALARNQRSASAADTDTRQLRVPKHSDALAALLLTGSPAAGIAAAGPHSVLPRTVSALLPPSTAQSVLGLRGGFAEEGEELPAEEESAADNSPEPSDSASDVADDETEENYAESTRDVLLGFGGGSAESDADEIENLPTALQVPVLISVYLLHLTWVSKTKMPLGKEMIPLENVVGIAAVTQYFVTGIRKWWLRRQQGEDAPVRAVPWGEVRNHPFTLILTMLMCMGAHWLSNYIGIAFDYGLLYLENAGVPMTWAQAYAMQQLFSHLAYVAMAVHAMGTRLRPFFPPPFGDGEWIRVRWQTNWLGWVVGGFYASTLACNSLTASCRALYNYLVKNAGLPPAPTDVQPLTETVINQLSRPGGGDISAFIIGLLAPCVSAPIFEELLYRGFLLPMLHRFMPLGAALPLQGLFFGMVHRAIPTLLPLSLLGWLWGWFYVRTGNLVIPMLMHAMWNSRSFVNSLLDKAY